MKQLSRWLPALVVALFIFALSAQQGAVVSHVQVVDTFAHKFAHLFLYFLLCFCFYRATKNPLLSFLLTVLYGISDELHQMFVPTRAGTVTDIIVDTTAALFGAVMLWKYFQSLPKILKNWLLE